ncbi:hypothetical protein [Nostoc sp.]|uniref:hypothetical protein n=1 Tax=Nostoc sp. TaxID=1180 RepID=UPI002FF6CDC2
MKGLEKLTTTKLSAWIQLVKIQAERGQITDRIPQLAKANPGWFAVHICCESGQTISYGDTYCTPPLNLLKTWFQSPPLIRGLTSIANSR